MTPTNWPWPHETTAGLYTKRWREEWRAFESIRNEPLWAKLGEARLAGEVAAATAWRIAAEADGWTFRQTYGHEPTEQAFTGDREGFKVQGLARLGDDNGLPHGGISMWGPDGISLAPLPLIYPGFSAIKALVRHCQECGADDVDTQRVAFANRACAKCAPDLRKKLERPGWCD